MSSRMSLVLALVMASGCKTTADTAPPEAAASSAKITLEAARNTALGRIPGKVVEEELEQEHGRLVYSFEIQPTEAGVKLKEVHVDANDGSIVAVEDEEAEDDKGEKDGKDDKDDKDDKDEKAD